jgi:hypothetical protein
MSGEKHLLTPLKNARITRLEKKLLNDVTSRLTDEKETGQRVVMTNKRKKLVAAQQAFQRRINLKIRHPDNSLMDFKTAVAGIGKAQLAYEKMFKEQQEWLELDKIYKPLNALQTANQVGLVQQAAKNFELSKQKLAAMTPVGV